jgi:hypothetical protein
VLKNENALLNSHAKEYKKQATILIIKNLKMYYLITIKIKKNGNLVIFYNFS